MWAFALTRIFPFVKTFWLPICLVLAAGVLYAYGRHVGSESRESEITALETKVGKLKSEAKEREGEIIAERESWAKRIEAITTKAASDAEALKTHHAAELSSADARLAAALKRLSDARASLAAALQPAASAPVTCRGFEADPTLLPSRDGELLIRLGDAADRILLERNVCVAAYNSLAARLTEGQVE